MRPTEQTDAEARSAAAAVASGRGSAAAMLASGALGARLVRMAQLAAAVHRAEAVLAGAQGQREGGK